MTPQAIGSPFVSPTQEYNNSSFMKPRQGSGLLSKKYSVESQMVSERYSSTSLSFDYTSKDGDTFSLSMESIEYSKSILDVSASGDKDDMKQLIDFIKNSYDAFKKDVLNGFLKSIGMGPAESTPLETKVITESSDKLEIPEYWNSENTSQRIVDFAVSFISLYEGSDEDYIEMIKGAIKDGFAQARDLMGTLSDEVSALVNDTYALTMDKLDSWAEQQGILIPETGDASMVA